MSESVKFFDYQIKWKLNPVNTVFDRNVASAYVM